METSVCPFVSHAVYGGPDFFGAPTEPYWLGRESMLVPQRNGRLLSLPISAGFNRIGFRWAGRIYRTLQHRAFSWSHMIGILYRFRLLRFIRLNPEMTSLEDMVMLCRAMIRRGASVFHMTFHSTNLGVGKTPYVPSYGAREAFLSRLEGVLKFLVNNHGVQPVTSREYYAVVRQHRAIAEPNSIPSRDVVAA